MNVAVPKELSDQFAQMVLSRTRKRYIQRLFWAVSISLLALLGAAFYYIFDAGLDTLDPRYIIIAVLFTLALLVLLGGLVVHDAYQLWQRSRERISGTRMQRRIFTMFCAVSIVPTLVITLFSVLFFNVGVNSWFDRQVSDTLASSVSIARAYLQEHQTNIRNHSVAIADVVKPRLGLLNTNPLAFEQLLTAQTLRRNLSEAVVFNRSGVLARTALSFSLIFERMPETVLGRADSTGDVIVISQDGDKIQGVLRLHEEPDIYLLITRAVDAAVVAQMDAARATSSRYAQLQSEMDQIQIQFLIAFCMLALLMFFASIWAGMRLAARLIGPVAVLNQATERVRAGDYAIRVEEGSAQDEIGNLARAFNRMTSQIEAGRRDLLEANRALDARRRFSETVLSGVSAGVLSLSEDYLVNLHNKRALKLLQISDEEPLHGMRAIDLLPEIKPLLTKVSQTPDKPASGDVMVESDRGVLTLHVRVTAERSVDEITGYVVTLDDITPLVQAQRKAAWQDVARRVAHEIKNPLTPITLSTERLRKKFAPEITSDKEGYLRYVDTISRHVHDIGKIVEEFVNFARLPNAVLKPQALQPIISKELFSEKTAHPDIDYHLQLPEEKVIIQLDETLLSQAILNVLKNAAEAFENSKDKTSAPSISVVLSQQDNEVLLKVKDNGPGFPVDKLQSLTEPYVTTRAKGTGLGLAIVKKTVEEHGGTLELENEGEGGGACVIMRFNQYSQ